MHRHYLRNQQVAHQEMHFTIPCSLPFQRSSDEFKNNLGDESCAPTFRHPRQGTEDQQQAAR
eukprot:1156435-Pelagomonas_calceolata.AAC.7